MDAKLQHKKIELIQWLSTLEDSSIIEEIMQLRQRESNEWRASITKEERISIEKGIKDADEGKITSHAEARKIYEKWL